MTLQQSLVSIRKMSSKDPLKMVFVLLLFSILPLLVVGTLTEVLLQSRAAYPISGATGSDQLRLKYRSSFTEGPSCPQSEGTCRNGKEVVVFYNSSGKYLADVKVDTIAVFTASNKTPINPSPVRAYITDSSGSQQIKQVDRVAPGQELYVAVESQTSIQSLPLEIRGEIYFSGRDCANNADNCTAQWAQSSVDLLFDRFIKTAAPAQANRIAIENEYITFTLDGFVVKKDGTFYYGTKENLVTNFNKISDNELIITARWTEQGDPITVIANIKKDAKTWWVDNISFNNGKSTLNIPYNAYPSPGSNAFEFKSLTIGTLNYESFVTFVHGRLTTTTWSTVEQNNEAALFDLNNDKILDLKDYTLVAHSYGKTGNAKFVKADLNGDGKVNKADADQLVNQIKQRKLTPYN